MAASADAMLVVGASSSTVDWGQIASIVYRRVCRTSLDEPGFALVRVDHCADSKAFRATMVELKGRLSSIHRSRTGKDLIYLSMGRFDQQLTTKPHRDGAPEESLLMLGYEPTTVASRLAMADYTRCAFARGLAPLEFLAAFNPMYAAGASTLADATTVLDGFTPSAYQIVLINNGTSAYCDGCRGMFGVLHQADIRSTDPTLRRVVNSTMIAAVPAGELEPVSADEQREFLQTDAISPRL